MLLHLSHGGIQSVIHSIHSVCFQCHYRTEFCFFLENFFPCNLLSYNWLEYLPFNIFLGGFVALSFDVGLIVKIIKE